jgi:Methane/Phenol/Toluene Hydroxylase
MIVCIRHAGCMFCLASLRLCDIRDTAFRWWRLTLDKWLRADALSVQRIAYRVRQLQQLYRGFATDSQTLWETDSLWQPLRMAVEKLLTCYDWAESFVGLNLVLKPLFDEMFMTHFSDLALREGDYLLGRVLYSLNEDCRWHREWSQALTRMVIEDNPQNRGAIQGWIDEWHPVAAQALQGFARLFKGQLDNAPMPPLEGVTQKLDRYYQDYLSGMGLQPSSSVAPLRF